MTDAERKSFFTHSSARGPGKRQIKANVALLNMPLPATEDDDDDVEYTAPLKDTHDLAEETDDTDSSFSGKESSGSSDENDESESEESSDEEADEDEEESDEAGTVEDGAEGPGINGANKTLVEKGPLVCSLCLNLRASVKKDEVIQCDRCGLAVHENCYITDTQDSDSDHSSSSTEPWFCEPCLYGLKEPPHCEFCPSRFGAFKKSDIGGGWAHLLCGLYTPGVTFGDVDHLTAISWQEMDYKNFGKKPCAACPDPVIARTGVTVSCDAGLCKTFYHISCAQRLGLLVDNSESAGTSKKRDHSKSKNNNNNAWYISDEEIADTYYLTCKRHATDDESVRRRKAACAAFLRQEEARMIGFNRRVNSTGEREERKRLAVLAKHRKILKDLEGVTIAWPEDERKSPRYLHSSPKFLQQFMEKAEDEGIGRHQFLREFTKVDGSRLSYLSPGFSEEFFSYYEAREKRVIPAELEKESKLKLENEGLRTRQKQLEADFLEVQRSLSKDYLENMLSLLNSWYMVLTRLGVKKIKRPEATIGVKSSLKPKRREGRVKRLSIAEEKPTSSAPHVSPQISGKRLSAPEVGIRIHACDTCRQSTDQHLLVYCDFCKKHFHLACLDPPLPKMPKIGRNHVWMCSTCGQSSDEDEEESSQMIVNDTNGENSKPLLRDRSALEERRRLEQQEQSRAFRAAMHVQRVPWTHRKRSLPTPKRKDSKQVSARKRSITSPLTINVYDASDIHDHSGGLSPLSKKARIHSTGNPIPNGLVSGVNGVRHMLTKSLGSPSLRVKGQPHVNNNSYSKHRSSTVSPVYGRAKAEIKQH